MNKQLPQLIVLLFSLTLYVHLYSVVSHMTAIRVITKCLLLPLLIIYLIVSTSDTSAIKKTALLALFFSWLGDVLLIGDGTLFFLAGMLAFMLTHIINGMLLIKLQPFRFKGSSWVGILLAAGAIGLIYYWLHDYLGTFLVPIVIYMVLIAAVWVCTFNLSNHVNYRWIAFYFFIPGMFFFVLSDALLALNKFLFHFPERWDVWVMLTYASAQLFLTLGYKKVIVVQSEADTTS
ncbi:MAG: lysoplasmalogenase [Chitinophagia bacterium]|nr:lysoplasmalogenase [Chitinophagia bacterium]